MSARSQDSFRIGRAMGQIRFAKGLLDQIRRPIPSQEVPTRPLYKVSHSLNNRLQFCMHDLDCIMRDLMELTEYRRDITIQLAEKRKNTKKAKKPSTELWPVVPSTITYHEESSE